MATRAVEMAARVLSVRNRLENWAWSGLKKLLFEEAAPKHDVLFITLYSAVIVHGYAWDRSPMSLLHMLVPHAGPRSATFAVLV